jgi:hypothetical protein
MRARGLLAVGLALAGSSAGGALAASATAPPSSGTWTIGSWPPSGGGAAANQLHGSFRVTGTHVTGFHATSGPGAIKGCAIGERISISKSVPIRHITAPQGYDFWKVGVNGGVEFVPVRITLQAPRSSARTHVGGRLEIFFPGTGDMISGVAEESGLNFGPSAAGYCNFRFSVAG